MRVLIVAHGFPPTHSSGAERRAERMANWLVANQHEVEVFAVEKVDDTGFRVETAHQSGYKVHRVYYDVNVGENPFRNSYEFPPIADAIRSVLTGAKFDLVHLVSGFLLAAQAIHTAHECDLPVVVTLTEYWFFCTRLNLIHVRGDLCVGPESAQKCMRCLAEEQRRYQFLAQRVPKLLDAYWSLNQYIPFAKNAEDEMARRQTVLREALNAANMVICPSHYLSYKFAEFGFDTRRFHFIRQGLVHAPEHEPVTGDSDTGVLRLGYVGQMKPHKGIDLAIEAVIGLIDAGRTVSLDLWGPEPETPEYLTQLKQRSSAYEAIRWRGQYRGAQVWDVLASLDALVMPSRWYENSPNAILEAYAMGVPVIATNLGGMAELIAHEQSGLLFELDNAADLQSQIARLLDEPGLLPGLRAGIPPIKTLDQEMKEIVAHYERLIQHH